MWWLSLLALIIGSATGMWGYSNYRVKKDEAKYPPAGRFVEVEGIRLHYISRGAGRPVVFLHGGILSCCDFERAAEIVAGQGYRAIALDRPGYGHSGRPAGPVSVDRQAELIHAALKQLGVDRPILVGHSWSGVLVLTYALQFPDDVTGIVALSAAMYKEGYPAENGDPVSRLATMPIIGSLLLHTLLRSPLGIRMTDGMLRQTFAPEPIPAGYREDVHALWLRPKQFRANREDILAFPPAASKFSLDYGSIKLPVVFAVGEDDPFDVAAQAERLKRDLPHAELVLLPEVAHMIPQNHPELVASLVHRLVSSKPGPLEKTKRPSSLR